MKLLVILILLGSSFSYAGNCQINDLSQVTVFTIEDQNLNYSDFEGLTVAGGSITAEDFRFGPGANKNSCDLSISLRGLLKVKNGSADRIVELNGPHSNLVKLNEKYPTFSYRRIQRTEIVQFEKLKSDLIDLSTQLAQLGTQDSSSNWSYNSQYQHLTIETINSEQTVFVNIDSQTMSETKYLEIKAQKKQKVVINIYGLVTSLQYLKIITENITPDLLIWNFANSSELIISNVGGTSNIVPPRKGDDSLGLQGLVIAPYATVSFTEAKITGSLWVKEIVRVDHRATGQVNQWDGVTTVSPPVIVKPK